GGGLPARFASWDQLAEKKKNSLARILLFAFWGAAPIPKYRLFNSVATQRTEHTLKQKKTALTSSQLKNNECLFLKKQRAYEALPKNYHILLKITTQ
ncbi:hypothetical protein, partial [Enterococcus faecium]